MVLVKRLLTEYLATPTDVDFAKQVQRRNGVGELEWVCAPRPRARPQLHG
jgi:hypothetical protein